jgi:hypothetical protein
LVRRNRDGRRCRDADGRGQEDESNEHGATSAHEPWGCDGCTDDSATPHRDFGAP